MQPCLLIRKPDNEARHRLFEPRNVAAQPLNTFLVLLSVPPGRGDKLVNFRAYLRHILGLLPMPLEHLRVRLLHAIGIVKPSNQSFFFCRRASLRERRLPGRHENLGRPARLQIQREDSQHTMIGCRRGYRISLRQSQLLSSRRTLSLQYPLLREAAS